MSNTDYSLISNRELVDRAEQGELHSNPELFAEFERRMAKYGTTYDNTPEEVKRWKADMALSFEAGMERNRKQESESSLNKIWSSPEEDEAWRDL